MYSSGAALVGALAAALWIAAGIAGAIRALVCLQDSRSGNMATKVIMVFVALITGPFYWLVQLFLPEYCKKGTQ